MVRTRQGWENWFPRLFAELEAASAGTDSVITGYQALFGSDMGFSVVEFTQSLTMDRTPVSSTARRRSSGN